MDNNQAIENWYWELTLVCSAEAFELISYTLFELGASGIEELGRDSGGITLRAFFPSSVIDPLLLLQQNRERYDVLKQISPQGIFAGKKPFQNWQEGWRDFFKPVEIGDSFLIRPPWETSVPGKKEIVIHPGQGFGTGYHESTHLALLLLEWVLKGRPIRSVTDVGTGSGILAIAALLLQAEHVMAIDLDRDALLEVPYNLSVSGLDKADVTLIQCGPEALVTSTELVVANIEGHILEKLADDLMRLTCQGGFLLLSGILTEHEESLLGRFKNRFELIKSMRMGEWSGFVLQQQFSE